jgi:hypothetical protein
MLRRYFAYGSNICAEQMARRCPAAVMGEVVALPGWRFAINRRVVATLLPEPGAEAGHYRRDEMEVAGAPALIYLATETRPGQPRQGYLERILAASALRGIPGGPRPVWPPGARP